jgi:hypothetical protein
MNRSLSHIRSNTKYLIHLIIRIFLYLDTDNSRIGFFFHRYAGAGLSMQKNILRSLQTSTS